MSPTRTWLSTLPWAWALLAMVAAAMVPDAATAREVSAEGGVALGLLADLSGRARAYGESLREGMLLAVDELNGRGGYRGIPYRLVVVDTKQDEKITSAMAVDLVYRKGVRVLVGTTDSGGTHIAARIAMRGRTPMITTVATDPLLTRNGNPWFFRILPDDRKQAAGLAEYLVGLRRVRSAFVIHQDSRYGRGGGRAFADEFAQRGGVVSAVVEAVAASEDHGQIVERVRSSGCQAVILWTLYGLGARLTKELRQAGVSALICGPDGFATPQYALLAGEAAEGAVLTDPFRPDAMGALASRFVTSFKGRYHRLPDSFAAHGYEVVHLLHDAFLRGGLEREALRDALACTKGFWGVTGRLRFDETGNVRARVYVGEIRGGTKVPIDFVFDPEGPGSSATRGGER